MILNGEAHVVCAETGELIGTFDEGTRVTSREEQQRQHNEKIKREKKEMLQRATGGQFVFVKVDNSLESLPPESVTKLIYLSTYSNYEGKLMITERKQMQRKELSKVLGLSERAANSFWGQVKDRYIKTESRGLMLLDTFTRGKLKRGSGVPYQKIWINGIRALYRATPVRQHKQLGYIFKMLPFINVEYNILCWNPTETDLEKIEPMTFKDFAEQIGYDETHISRLKTAYNKLIFNVEGIRQLFCNFTYNPEYVIINPRVIYEGSQWDKVEILGVFCKS